MFPLEHSLVQLYQASHHVYFANFSLSEWILRLYIEVLNRLQQTHFDGVANSWWVVLMSWITCWMSIVMSWWNRLVPGLIAQPAQSSLLTSWFKGGMACLSMACLHIIRLICEVVWACGSYEVMPMSGVNCMIWLCFSNFSMLKKTGYCC